MNPGYVRIVAAIDNGDTRDAVIDRAVAIAASSGAQLRFAHVCDPEGLHYKTPDWSEPIQRFKNKVADRVESALQNVKVEEGFSWDIEIIDPFYSLSTEIYRSRESISSILLNKIIAPFEPDLVLCGERGISRFRKTLMGSTSKYLLQNVPCDVTIVR